jgi:hypothetical protein
MPRYSLTIHQDVTRAVSCFDITQTPLLLHNSEKYGGFHDCTYESSGVIFEL